MPSDITAISTSTISTTSNPQIWIDWARNTTHTTSSTTADSIWTVWSTASTATTLTTAIHTHADPVLARQRASDLAHWRAEQAERSAVERRIAEEATARAEQLLLAILSNEQRETYQRARHIIVVGRSGRRYRVRRGRIGNIDVIGRNGHIESRLCAHPGIWTPDPDVMLAQLLHLQHDDDEFCRTANVHDVLSNEGRILEALAH